MSYERCAMSIAMWELGNSAKKNKQMKDVRCET